MRCHDCGALAQFCGTSQDGSIEWHVCPDCNHVQFVAVSRSSGPIDPTVDPKPDGHLGAVER